MDTCMHHDLKWYEDARKLCHIEKEAKTINARKLVIADYPTLMGNARPVGIQHNDDTWLYSNKGSIKPGDHQ